MFLPPHRWNGEDLYDWMVMPSYTLYILLVVENHPSGTNMCLSKLEHFCREYIYIIWGKNKKKHGETTTYLDLPVWVPYKVAAKGICWVLLVTYVSSWWLNQPMWKILVKMGIFPNQGCKFKKKWHHHLVFISYFSIPVNVRPIIAPPTKRRTSCN